MKLKWRRERLFKNSFKERKIFSFTIFMIIILASFTTIFIVIIPERVEAITSNYYSFNSRDTKLNWWWTTNANGMITVSTADYASTTSVGDSEWLQGNACSGGSGTISAVYLQAFGYATGGACDVLLRPRFGGTTEGENDPNYDCNFGTSGAWGVEIDITNDAAGPGSWTWTDVVNLDVKVESIVEGVTFSPNWYVSAVRIKVTYTPSNSAPVNGAPSYGGWDEGEQESPWDNCYATKEYTITVDYTDVNGATDLDWMSLQIRDPVVPMTVVGFKYTEATGVFSEFIASSAWSLTSSGLGDVTPIANGFSIDWKFIADWNAIEQSDYDILLYCADDGALSDIDPFDAVFDVVTTIGAYNLECTDDTEDEGVDRVDIGSEIAVDYGIRFMEEPGSSMLQPEAYPVDSAFEEVYLYLIEFNDEPIEPIPVGSSRDTVNGDGSINFPIEGEVGVYDYQLFVSMISDEYVPDFLPEIEESIIGDQISILDISAEDERINVGDQAGIQVDTEYAYDSQAVSAESLTISGATFSNVGGGAFRATPSQGSVTQVTYNTWNAATGDVYGLTGGTMNGRSVSVTWDQIVVNWSANQHTIDVGDEVTISLNDIIYDYDNAPVSGAYSYDVTKTFWGQSGTTYEDDYSMNSFTFTPRKAGYYNFTISSFSESTYGLTANQINQTIQLTVKQNINLVKNSLNTIGLNYVTWGVNNSVKASKLADDFGLGVEAFIYKFDPDSPGEWWSTIRYDCEQEVGDFTINRWDHIAFNVASNVSYSFTPDYETDTTQYVEMEFDENDVGYNFITWSNDFNITTQDLHSQLPTDDFVVISVYNPTTDTWRSYNPSIPEFFPGNEGFYIEPYDVICFNAGVGHENVVYDTSAIT